MYPWGGSLRIFAPSSPGWMSLRNVVDTRTSMMLIDSDVAGLARLSMDADDDLALLMAAHEHIAAVTVTWGNAPASVCHASARRLLQRIGRMDVPVFLGSECSLPLPFTCPSPAPTSAASAAIAAIVSRNPGKVTLVALGPLSNIAAALRARPVLAAELSHIIIVGGSIDRHANLARRLAANYYWLPDLGSTQAVLSSRARKTLMPVETMAAAHLDVSWLRQVSEHCCPTSAVCEYLPALASRAEAHVMQRLFPERRAAGWIPWDAVVMALVQQPQLFSGWMLHVARVRRSGVSILPRVGAIAGGRPAANASAMGWEGATREGPAWEGAGRRAVAWWGDSTADASALREPFTVAVPVSLNRSGVIEHITHALCRAPLNAAASMSPARSLPVVWQNVPVQILNRGTRAFEPLGMPSPLLAIILVIALLGLVCGCNVVMCWCRRYACDVMTARKNGLLSLAPVRLPYTASVVGAVHGDCWAMSAAYVEQSRLDARTVMTRDIHAASF